MKIKSILNSFRELFMGLSPRLRRQTSPAPRTPQQIQSLPGPPPALHIVITGWNCEKFAEQCLDSVEIAITDLAQPPKITLVDDGSNDDTAAVVDGHQLSHTIDVITNTSNKGAAFSRHISIQTEVEGETVMVCIDLDDWVLPHAFVTIQDAYWSDPSIWATFGNWIDQYGRRNPQGFYSDREINLNMHRSITPFNGTHIRTFRRFLYDAIANEDMQDAAGEWLTVCTDAAMVMPLLDQCEGQNVAWIDDPIYVYRRHSASGTIARFGGHFKEQTLQAIAIKQVKPRHERTCEVV